jgi:hypothetical protein
MITQQYLHSIINYNQNTGIFTCKKKFSKSYNTGDVLGKLSKAGYFSIRINNKPYQIHRIAWLYMYGNFPSNMIDHINGIKTDNRLCNLREATNQENLQNQIKPHKNNKLGILGVCFDKSKGKFKAYIRHNKILINIGYYITALEAHQAYLLKKRELHKFSTI